MPLGAPNPFAEGFNTAPTTWANTMDISAGGFELLISANNLNLGSIKWTTAFNLSLYNKARIDAMSAAEGLDIEFIRSGSFQVGSSGFPPIENRVGELVGNIIGSRFLGVDENGIGTYDPQNISDWSQYHLLGNAMPGTELGWANHFAFGSWDLSIFFRGTFGHDLINSTRRFYEHQDPTSNTGNSVQTDKSIRTVSPPYYSDFFAEDASFLRLDNLQLAYSFSSQNDWLNSVRVYLAAQNLFTITGYAGIDPEVRWQNDFLTGYTENLTMGIENRDTYFQTRTWSLGIEFSLN